MKLVGGSGVPGRNTGYLEMLCTSSTGCSYHRSMSRSRKKTPIHGFTTAITEAEDKALWHRAFRRGERQRIQLDIDPLPCRERQYSDPWKMDKDGKRYSPEDPKLMRK